MLPAVAVTKLVTQHDCDVGASLSQKVVGCRVDETPRPIVGRNSAGNLAFAGFG
jgi:hypothetical protein